MKAWIAILIVASNPVIWADEVAPLADATAVIPVLPDTPIVLSIDATVSSAINNHPLLRAAEATIQARQHRVYQATRKPNPTVGYLAAEVGNDGEAGQQGIFIAQDIVRGDKLCLNGKVRQRDVGVALKELEVERQKVIADARLAFLDVAVEQERLKLLLRLQESLDRAVNAVRRLVDSGELSLSAALQSKLEAQRNLMQIRKTETRVTVAKSVLAAILGQELSAGKVDEAALLPSGQVPSTADAWANISSNSPEIQVVTGQYDRNYWQVRREEAEPTPDLQTQWSLQQDAATNHTVLGIQIGVELPIRDTNSGAINAARAETWRTHHQQEAVRRSLRRRLAATLGTYQTASQQLATIKTQLEALARENLQTTQKAFALGEATYLDLLNAQRAYIRLSLDTLVLYRQIAVADTHLQTFLVRASQTVEQ